MRPRDLRSVLIWKRTRARPASRSVLALSVVAMVASPGAVIAQGTGDPVSQSVREPALGMLDQLDFAVAGFAPGEMTYKLLLIPNFTAVSGADIYGTTVGLKIGEFRKNTALQIRGIGKIIDTGADTRNRFGADAKLVYADTSPLSAALKATYVHTAEVSDRTEGEVAVDYRFYKGVFHSLKAGLTAKYASTAPETGEKESANVFATGLTWALGAATEINAAYEFDNDLSGEDSFSMTLGQALPQLPWNTVLLVTAGKHRLIAVSIALSF